MSKLSSDDRQTFRDAVRDVKPLGRDAHESARGPTPLARARFRRAEETAVLAESLTGALDPAELETGDELVYRRPGLPAAEFRRLRRAQFSIEAELDLHGLRSNEAKAAMAEFLRRCLDRGLRCVRIVHGKGRGSGHDGPVLKPRVARWLRQRNDVLGYCSARAVDGGTGALYVLLARR